MASLQSYYPVGVMRWDQGILIQHPVSLVGFLSWTSVMNLRADVAEDRIRLTQPKILIDTRKWQLSLRNVGNFTELNIKNLDFHNWWWKITSQTNRLKHTLNNWSKNWYANFLLQKILRHADSIIIEEERIKYLQTTFPQESKTTKFSIVR